MGLAILAAPPAALSAAAAASATKKAAKPPAQRARLPRRLAADFHSHIETRLPHLRAPFENAARDTGFGWRLPGIALAARGGIAARRAGRDDADAGHGEEDGRQQCVFAR